MASKNKATPNNKTLVLVCGILVLLLMVVGFKYAVLRAGWRVYSGEAQNTILTNMRERAEEQARVVGMGGMFKMNGRELYRSPKELQSYVSTIGSGLKHSIVVTDRNSTILADTTAENIGKKYMGDANGDVQKTVSDGLTRTFTEKISGVSQTVIALKDSTGTTIGAIIFSTDATK